MTSFESFCVTGTGFVYTVQPDFAYDDYADIGQQTDLGSLDAPKYTAGGSMLSERWYGIDGQSVINRDKRP